MVNRIGEGGTPPIDPSYRANNDQPPKQENLNQEESDKPIDIGPATYTRVDLNAEKRFFRSLTAGINAQGQYNDDLLTQAEAEAAGYKWDDGRPTSNERQK